MRPAISPCDVLDYDDGIYGNDDDWILDHVEDHTRGLIEALVNKSSNAVVVNHLEEIIFALGLPSELITPLHKLQETGSETSH